MPNVDVWTGRTATALKRAFRHTNESFAEGLGTAVRTVAKWSSDPDRVPTTELQRALDTMYQLAGEDVKERFTQAFAHEDRELRHAPKVTMPAHAALGHPSTADVRLLHDPVVAQILTWLDGAADWMPGEARQRTARSLETVDSIALSERTRARGAVDRASIATALSDYYGEDLNGHAAFSASVDGRRVDTSVLTRSDWLDMRTPLGSGADHFEMSDQPEPRSSWTSRPPKPP